MSYEPPLVYWLYYVAFNKHGPGYLKAGPFISWDAADAWCRKHPPESYDYSILKSKSEMLLADDPE